MVKNGIECPTCIAIKKMIAQQPPGYLGSMWATLKMRGSDNILRSYSDVELSHCPSCGDSISSYWIDEMERRESE